MTESVAYGSMNIRWSKNYRSINTCKIWVCLVYQYYRIVFRAPRGIENLSRSIKLKIRIEIIYVWGKISTFDFINTVLATSWNSSPRIFRLTTLFTSDVLIDSPTYLRPTSRDLRSGPSEREFQRVGRTIII